MNNKTTTRKFYSFERSSELAEIRGLWTDQPMWKLRRLAMRVWKDHGMTRPLTVVAGRGDPLDGCDHRLCSYEQGGRIVLARDGRSVGVLLHEVAHALGTHDKLVHGPAFAKRCLGLYVQYGRVPLDNLLNAAMENEII